jgi:predicted MFS family arabinose efflux permease
MSTSIQEPRQPQESTDPPWRVIAPLSLTVFVALMYLVALGPLVEEIASDFDVSIALVGQVSTVILLTMAIAGLVSGPLADHYGQKRSIVTGLAVLSLSALIMASASSFWLLLVAGFVAGFAASMTIVVFGLVAASFQGEMQRKAISRVQASQSTGSIIGAPLLTTIAAVTVWRGAYIFLAILLALACLLVLRSVAADRPWPNRRASIVSVLDAYRPLLSDRSMVNLFTASAMRALGWIGPLVYLGAFFIDEHGLSLRQVGLAYMLASGGVFLGNLAVGGPLGRLELRTLFAGTTMLMGIGWLVIFVINPPVAPTLVALAATAFVGGAAWVSMTSMLAAETPAGPATTMVFNASMFGFSSAIGVAIAGALIAVSGYQALGFVFPVFIFAAAALIWTPGLALRAASTVD